MIQLPQPLPDGVLLGHENEDLRLALAATGAHWLAPRPGLHMGKSGAITGWSMKAGGDTALPAAANSGQSAIALHRDHPALALQTEVNGGFVVHEVAANAARFTLAVIYAAPHADARTLASLRIGPAETANLLFLSHADGVLTAKDRSGGVAVDLPLPARQDHFRLVIASWDRTRLILQTGAAQAESRGRIVGAEGPVDLFIGCRGHRKGLTKTLGNALIGDVFFWPDCSLLAPRDAADQAQLAALHSYVRWHYG